MDVLVTCKYEEYPIKNEGPRVVKTLYINILDANGQITQESAVVSGEYLIKNEGARVVTTLYINILDANGQITQESVVVSG